jgi:hypothetical protein
VKNDPLGLFAETPQQPAKQPTVGSFLQNIALISVVCICGAMFWDAYGDSFYDRRGDGDKDEQVEPAPTDKPASIVFVRELQNAPASEALLMREVRKLGIDFRDLDDDLDAAGKYLQYGLTKGVQPPLVVLQNAANQPYAVYSWPTLEQVKGWVK